MTRTMTIGQLPPSLQGIALDLEIDEEVAIITDEHHSVRHGDHFDVYFMRRWSESQVILSKSHSDDLIDAPWVNKAVDNAINRPITDEEDKIFSWHETGGC